MVIKNIIVIDGQEYDFEDLSPQRRRQSANVLNERVLGQLGYERENNGNQNLSNRRLLEGVI